MTGRQSIVVEVGGGARLAVDVWQDEAGRWRACAPTHYPPLATAAADTPVKALAAVQAEATLSMSRRVLGASDVRDGIDTECGPPDLRAVQFTYYWNLLRQGEPAVGPGWQEEAVRELLTISRLLGQDGKRAHEADAFLLWLGKKIAAEGFYSNSAKANLAPSVRNWHTQLARIVTSATPWAPRRDGGNIHTPIEDMRRAEFVERLRRNPLIRTRKKAERLVGTGAKGAVDREAARKKRDP